MAADQTLADCVRSVAAQTFRDFEIVVIDNSGAGRAARLEPVSECARVIENPKNAGFGAAVNQAIRESEARYIAVLNDDAIARPQWLEAMIAAAEERSEIGMCAPQIRLFGEDRLDSAGMLLAGDASSKQRGHLEPPASYSRRAHVLFPSGCAALYRRAMLDEVGLFDETFFLFCEDTDLGLRARWRMWECVYIPEAVVEHRYSRSSGRASQMKAWYVERNRLRAAVKNLPASMLALAPLHSVARYFWHLVYMGRGSGKTAEFRDGGGSALHLPWIVVRAHLDLFRSLPRLWRERRAIRRTARLTPKQFAKLLRSHAIPARRVAAL